MDKIKSIDILADQQKQKLNDERKMHMIKIIIEKL